MDFELTEEQEEIRRVAREFAAKEIAPTADADYKAHRFPRGIVNKMAELGFFGCVIPEKYGGTGLGHLTQCIITEEVARVSPSLRLPFNMQTVGPALTILHWGSEMLRQNYIPRLVSAEIMGCFAISEPNAGSDVAAMETTAALDGDHFVVNGTKTWASQAQVADLVLFYAYTDKSLKHRGISAFVIESTTPGYHSAPLEDKLGLHSAPTGTITFEDCRIPKGNLVGELGEGFKICMWQLDNTRLSSAAGAVGVAQGCLDQAAKYAMEREQFGQKIGTFQMNQEIIARMAVDVEAARLLIYRAAYLKDKGVPHTLEVSMAKYFAAETAVRAADGAMRILSSYGYSDEYPTARFYRDARSYTIVEGTSNIQKLIISQDVLGIRKANKAVETRYTSQS